MRRLAAAGLVPVARHHAHGLHSPYWWLRALVGPANDTHSAVAAYHRLLVWDIERGPRTTRAADRLLSPVIGKSLVVYVRKPVPGPATRPAVTGPTAPVAQAGEAA